MATVHIAISRAGGLSREKISMPVFRVAEATTESITSSASNQATTIAASTAPTGQSGWFAQITCTGGNVIVSFGSAPNAGTDSVTFLILDGQTRDFGIAAGDKVAVIDA